MATLKKELLEEVFERYDTIQKNKKTNQKKAPISEVRLRTMISNTLDTPQEAFEKIRNNNNLAPISFLLRGFEVGQSVGLICDTTQDPDNEAIGTAFLIAPNLLLTNNHVIEEIEMAENYALRMNYQRDLNGQIEPFYDFRLRPDLLFVTNQDLDFTIVAVGNFDTKNKVEIAEFGYLKLLGDKGKISEGEFCTVIQHPAGRPKQIVMFENEVTSTSHPDFLLYQTDTISGSSGSPVFNYEWVVVALHHAGVPTEKVLQELAEKVEENSFDREKNANEGVRISAIVKYLKENEEDCYNQIYKAAMAKIDQTLPRNPYKYARPTGQNELLESIENKKEITIFNNQINVFDMETTSNVIRFNLPLEIRLGAFDTQFIVESADNDSLEKRKKKKKKTPPTPPVEDDRQLNPSGRNGYNANFLSQQINLVDLYAPFKQKGTVAPLLAGAEDELKYMHFSNVMHKKRRMCIITGVNIDGSKTVAVTRGNDNWLIDARMSPSFQLGNSVYANNDLDRGHMVRRQDPIWGTESDARQANEDTFFFTNACPQHKDLNQKTWLELEDYVLKSADNHDLKVSVFTGPILDENYVQYREALVPAQFYKIVAMIKKDGKPSVTGYVLSQKDLISGLERVQSDFVFGQFKTYQVSLSKIAEMTGLDLEKLKKFDPLKGDLESLPIEIESAQDLRF
jgi:endonuclease G, mitochondrial